MIGDMNGASAFAAQAAAPTAAAPSAGGLGNLGGEAFLNLLVAQLRYQNPMSPSDPSAMLQQTAAFTQVETMQRLAATQQQLLGLQRATVAADMVGKEVTAQAADGATITGLVDGVRFTGTGPVLLLGDREVPVEQVTGFSTVANDTSSPSTT